MKAILCLHAYFELFFAQDPQARRLLVQDPHDRMGESFLPVEEFCTQYGYQLITVLGSPTVSPSFRSETEDRGVCFVTQAPLVFFTKRCDARGVEPFQGTPPTSYQQWPSTCYKGRAWPHAAV